LSDYSEFDDLIVRLRANDSTAAEAVFRRFASRLIALAHSRLDARMRGKTDPEDVAQSALKSFLLHVRDGEYDLNDWDSLWSLLTVITLRKCNYRVRHFRAARRDVRKEIVATARNDEAAWELIARDPTPEEAFELIEVTEELFRGLDPIDSRILQLSLQGYTPGDAAREAGVSERTAYRLLERVKGRLTRKIEKEPLDS
jgi:RNA polymerase sigma-70 factor (ECF subfamily)